jgi:YD repeat-containing protein
VITDANGNASQMGYDPAGLFTLSTTNTLGQVTRYDYFGVNGTALQTNGSTTYGATFGLLKAVTDPNGALTEYRYDSFGRLTQVIRPNDSETWPTTQYTYTDAYNAGGLLGLRIQTTQREVSGNASAVRPLLEFYDGLGRLVQTRNETVDGAEQVVVNTTSDALGRATWASVPVT